MNFKKLPSNSKALLDDILRADNPADMLSKRFDDISNKEDEILRSIIRELQQGGYINVSWADNKPYRVVINNVARTYDECLKEFETVIVEKTVDNSREIKIFISHRTEDAEVADMLRDFFVATGIPNDYVFCSSLPGNDVKTNISREVKEKIKNSTVNIAILSNGYYQSAYCLNEAGIFWFNDDKVPVIAIGLPEISHTNMHGFINGDYKLRRLDNENDIADIYDAVRKAVDSKQAEMAVCTAAGQKLLQRYNAFLANRQPTTTVSTTTSNFSLSEITTDDEKIVLYYILKNNVRKVSKSLVAKWLNENEIYDVNVDNAFDLLSSFEGGLVANDTLEFGIGVFRKYSSTVSSILPELQKCVEQHTKLAIDTFKTIWNSDIIEPTISLFVAYIVDGRISSFGDRWMADMEIESIKQWEIENSLGIVLSSNYGNCLGFFIQNNLVYESDWTSYGNPRAYSLCHSLREYLFNCPSELIKELQDIKKTHELPF